MRSAHRREEGEGEGEGEVVDAEGHSLFLARAVHHQLAAARAPTPCSAISQIKSHRVVSRWLCRSSDSISCVLQMCSCTGSVPPADPLWRLTWLVPIDGIQHGLSVWAGCLELGADLPSGPPTLTSGRRKDISAARADSTAASPRFPSASSTRMSTRSRHTCRA